MSLLNLDLLSIKILIENAIVMQTRIVMNTQPIKPKPLKTLNATS